MIKKIIKSILTYAIFYLISKVIFSLLLFGVCKDTSVSLQDFIFLMIQGETIQIEENIFSVIIFFTDKIVDASAIAVLTSFIFAYILNKEPQIVFPTKLVIRHRTSWESRNKLTMGIMIGNRSHYDLHNVVCSITCSYIKQEEPLLINSEFTLCEERICLENYYRFSFDLSKFPRQVLKDILDKPSYWKEETIVVCVTGNCNGIGNSFRITKKYNLSDIVYDEHEPRITVLRKNIFTGNNLKNPFTKKNISKIRWEEVHRIVDVNEEGREKSIKEIKYMIKSKKKSSKQYV